MIGIKKEETEKGNTRSFNGGGNGNGDLAAAAVAAEPSESMMAIKEASIYIQKQHLLKPPFSGGNTEKTVNKRPVKPYPKVEPPSTNHRLKRNDVFGLVRGSPYGACLDGVGAGGDNDIHTDTKKKRLERVKHWKEWREANFDPINFPIEGFDHIYGTQSIQDDDYGAEAAAIAAHNPMPMDVYADGDNDGDSANGTSNSNVNKEGREYGSIRTPLDAPIGSLKDKWRVLPHFLQVRSLMRQHIDSFDYFVNTEMKEIVQSPSACEIRSEHDPKFYLRYTDCWVGEPSVQEDSYTPTQVTPFQCRLRDCTYSAPIYVNIRYTRGRQIVVKKKVSVPLFYFCLMMMMMMMMIIIMKTMAVMMTKTRS